jgi:ABC-2 type transport system ATP-binding protein
VNASIGSEGLAVRVDSVTQRFSLHHEKTLRGLVVNAVRRSHPNRETFLALEDVSLDVPVGSTMGLIGHNGSGKSTLLKIIGGVVTPTRGLVTRRGTLAALLELGAGFQRDLSGRENVFMNAELLGLSRKQTEARFDEIVDFSGVGQFIDTPMKFYSSGMFVRLGFSVAIHTDPDVLLVDEVLAVGDEEFRAKCLDVVRTMQGEGRTIILVTHNIDEVIARFRELTANDAPRRSAARTVGTRPSPNPGSAGSRTGARVVHADVRALSGRSLSQFRPPDGLIVDAVFSVPGTAAASGVVGRVEIFSGGHLLHASWTDRLGMVALGQTSNVCMRFTLPDLPLAGGRYRVAVSVARDGRAPALHAIPTAAEIQVLPCGRFVGPLRVSPSVEQVE